MRPPRSRGRGLVGAPQLCNGCHQMKPSNEFWDGQHRVLRRKCGACRAKARAQRVPKGNTRHGTVTREEYYANRRLEKPLSSAEGVRLEDQEYPRVQQGPVDTDVGTALER